MDILRTKITYTGKRASLPETQYSNVNMQHVLHLFLALNSMQ